jgi:hypothetical protein
MAGAADWWKLLGTEHPSLEHCFSVLGNVSTQARLLVLLLAASQVMLEKELAKRVFEVAALRCVPRL